MMMRVHALIGALVVLLTTETLAVRIVSPSQDEVFLSEGNSLSIECEDAMDPIMDWKLNGMSLRGNANYEITEENGGKTSILHIKSASEATEGSYRCELDPFENDEIRITVQDGGDADVVTIVEPDTESMTVVTGDQLNMKCTGGQDVDVLWYHKGMLVSEDSRVVITTAKAVDTGKVTSLISIRKVTEADGGQYQCKNEEDPLFDVDEVNVIVLSDDDDDQDTVEIFSPSEPSLSVELGHILSLKCRAPGGTDIVWYHDDEELTDDEDESTIISDGTEGDKSISMLTVEDVNADDGGIYYCKNADDLDDDDFVNVNIGSDEDEEDDDNGGCFLGICGASSSTSSLATILIVALLSFFMKLN